MIETSNCSAKERSKGYEDKVAEFAAFFVLSNRIVVKI